jgi:hypothetical protein
MWNPFKSPRIPQGKRGSMFSRFILGRRFDPGAEAEVFIPATNTPVILYRGRGRAAGTFGTLQPAQAYFYGAQGVIGLGGVQAGQVIGQPLIDPSQLNTEPGE